VANTYIIERMLGIHSTENTVRNLAHYRVTGLEVVAVAETRRMHQALAEELSTVTGMIPVRKVEERERGEEGMRFATVEVVHHMRSIEKVVHTHLTGTNIVEAVEVEVTGTIMIGIVTEVGHNSVGHRTLTVVTEAEAESWEA